MIRRAEPRDIPKIYEMFLALVDYLEEQGQNLYVKDLNIRHNNIMGFIIGKFYHDDSLILVNENQEREPNGFMIGQIRPMEPFFKFGLVGEIQWTYPLSLNTRQFAKEFEKWALEKGATATSNYSTPGNTRVEQAFIHEGRQKVWHYFMQEI